MIPLPGNKLDAGTSKRVRQILFLCYFLLFPILATPRDCYESSIVSPTPFMGRNAEIIKLADGSLWKVKHEYEDLYAYYPNVILCPSLEKLIVGEKTIDVERLASGEVSRQSDVQKGSSAELIESQIDGEFEGWDGKTTIKLTNGQVWQQNQYYYRKYYAYMPKVFIFSSKGQYRMKVHGINKSVGVKLVE